MIFLRISPSPDDCADKAPFSIKLYYTLKIVRQRKKSITAGTIELLMTNMMKSSPNSLPATQTLFPDGRSLYSQRVK